MAQKTAEEEEPPALLSIDDVKPSEEGGAIARTGFNYQDQIACSLFIDMLRSPDIIKIHCETHDDIVAVRGVPGSDTRIAEYTQVKSNDKTWTATDICAVKASKSVYETSLMRDCHAEVSLFRIVTLRPVAKELRFLTFALGSPGREPEGTQFEALRLRLSDKFPDLKSAKGNGCGFWIANCLWDVRESEAGPIRNNNLIGLLTLAHAESRPLLLDHVQTLLAELLHRARTAGAASWHPDKAKKIITRTQLRDWWETRTQELIDGALTPSGGKLRSKMIDAGLPESLIRLAQSLRRDYAQNVRASRYMEPTDMEQLQARVKSEIMSLGSQLIAGEINLDGLAFHNKCMNTIDAFMYDDVSPEAIAFCKGCLYDIADRCQLRFNGLGT